MTIETVRARLQAEVTKAGSLRLAAPRLGVSHAFIADVIAGNRKPSPRLLSALGITRTITTTVRYQASPKA